MKNLRKFIPALAMLVLSAVLMSTASFAWFSMNTEVEVNGMKVKAQADGNLIINDEIADNFTGVNVLDLSEDFANATALQPVSYLKTSANVTTEGWYGANGESVEMNGAIKTDAENPYVAVTADNKGNYFLDKVVYIAAAGAPITNQKLGATVTFEGAAGDSTLKATSVAFYTVTDTSITATNNAYTFAFTDTAEPTKKVVLAENQATQTIDDLFGSAIVIPSAAQADGATENTASYDKVIPVLIRIYFDGALTTTDGTYYVRSEKIDPASLGINVKFTAVAYSN